MTEKLQRSAIQPRNPLLNASRNSKLPHVPGIRFGDYIFLSGLVPVDPQTGERSHGPITDQVRVTLSNMQHMLESAGSSLERVLRVHVVLADISHMAEMDRVYREFFPTHSVVNAASVRQRLRDRVRGVGGLSGGSRLWAERDSGMNNSSVRLQNGAANSLWCANSAELSEICPTFQRGFLKTTCAGSSPPAPATQSGLYQPTCRLDLNGGQHRLFS